MANTTLTQTGAEVQAAINKAEKLPTVTGSDNGKTLQVDGSGNFVANTVSGGGTQLYKHTLTILTDHPDYGDEYYSITLISNNSTIINTETLLVSALMDINTIYIYTNDNLADVYRSKGTQNGRGDVVEFNNAVSFVNVYKIHLTSNIYWIEFYSSDGSYCSFVSCTDIVTAL